MQKTFKYRIYPTKAQETLLEQWLELCRLTYNSALCVKEEAWQQRQESMSLYDTIKLLPRWKQEFPPLRDVHSQVLQNVCVRVDLAFQAFFRRVENGETSGYPKHKKFDQYRSITYPQTGIGFRVEDGKLWASKIGWLKMVMHRPIEGEIKTLTIHKEPTGKWYACFAVEYEAEPQNPTPYAVGIDMGLEKFAVLSTGEVIDNPRFFRQEEKALARAQRKLSQAERGTPEYRRRKNVVARIHERIKHKRHDFVHQLSRRLVDEFQVIVFEDLSVRNMVRNHHLAKSIADAAWTQLIQATIYKAKAAGKTVVLVDPRNTSQQCSQCGELVEKDLSNRVHQCPFCECELDRDLNAALNILALGLQCLGFNP